jgi:Tfp pilus assembly PilM family ATPase
MNPFSQLIAPRYPSSAVGIESTNATVVHLDYRRREGFVLRRAATVSLPAGLVTPNYDERNIQDTTALAQSLSDVALGAGLGNQHKWSVALPEAATRTLVLTLENAPATRGELDEVLRWKIERGFGASLEELRFSRDKLKPDAQGRARYIVTGMHQSVLDEYEETFAALGWRTGLVLPRHMGEARWLARSTPAGDALLLSSHSEGFTALLVRDREPLITRSVMCEDDDRDDELYRLLLFYRDRLTTAAPGGASPSTSLQTLLVMGEGFDKEHVSEIIAETLDTSLHALSPVEIGLAIPSSDLSFDAIAAPAGLATLAWK